MDIKRLQELAGLKAGEDPKEEQGNFEDNIEELTIQNTDYRRVLNTTKKTQLVLMSLKPGEEIGAEVHKGDQFIRIEAGEGVSILNGDERQISDGTALVVESGTEHNIVNTSETEDMKLYTVYSPPQHKPDTVQRTKANAED